MKATKVLLTVALLAVVAGSAYAVPYVGLSWDQCSPQVPDKTWSGPHAYSMFVVMQDFAPVPYSGTDTRIVVNPNIQDAWRFDDAGCQGAAGVAYSTGGTKTCLAFQGEGALSIAAYLYDPETRAVTMRLANTFGAFLPVPGQMYAAWIITYDHQYSVVGPGDPGNTCGGAEMGSFFDVFTDVLLESGPMVHCQRLPGDRVVTWNGGPPTATQPATWSRVKGIYR